MPILLPQGKQYFETTAGIPLVGGKLYTYDAGTTNPRTTYSDAAGTQPNTNPIILDSRGEALVFWAGVYKVVLKDSLDNTIWTVDNVGAITQDNTAVDAGTVNSIALTISQLASLTAFTRIIFKASNTNTGAVTISINGGATKALTYQNLAALDPGEIQASGMYEAVYDGTQWQLQGPTLQAPQFRTAAEISAGVTPVNYAYPPGHVYRYGTNTTPGTTDMTAAHNAAANAARAGNYSVILGVNCLVTSSLNFSRVRVVGPGAADPNNGVYNIVASSAQFDVITSTGQSVFENFSVYGGWDGATAGMNGDTFSLTNTVASGGDGFCYNCHFRNVRIQRSKKRAIYWEGAGYGSVFACRSLESGLHGIEFSDGPGGAYVSTTVTVSGESVFSNTPNGYGAKITNGVSITFRDAIMEVTKGIRIDGLSNRSLTFDNVYQELTSGLKFIDLGGGGGGIGLTVVNCFGAGAAVDPLTNWQDVSFDGNSLLTEPAIPLANKVFQADSGENLTATTGGVSITVTSISLGAGVYILTGTLQTLQSTASTMTQAAMTLTTNAAHTGLANQTNASFEEAAAQENYNPGSLMDQRLNCMRVLRITSTTTIYMRARLVFSGAGNLAYHGWINAVKIH